MKQLKNSSIFGNSIDPKFQTLDKQLKVAFAEIKRDMDFHKDLISELREQVKDLKSEMEKLKEDKVKTTPLMDNILELIKIRPMNSKEIYYQLQNKGLNIHEKSIPRAIKYLLKIEKIKREKEGKSYNYILNNNIQII
ncbi:hypothetical protein JXM83_00490 [Candidatus Woesearchaeota archaeon]|nr:hypothetical protein [Candidatus Woesearchaeota archaeon]